MRRLYGSRETALHDAAEAQARPDGGGLPTWDLTDLFPAARLDELRPALRSIEDQARGFAAKYKGRLESLRPAEFAAAVDAYQKFEESLARLSAFAELLFSAQSDDPASGQLLQFVTEQATSTTSELLFFTLEINRLDDETIAAWQSHESVRPWRPWLRDLRVFRNHQLSNELERLFNEKDVVDRGWSRLFDQTLAAMQIPLGAEQLTLSATLSRLSDTSGQVRQEAAAALSRALGAIRPTASLVLNTLSKNKAIIDDWRHYRKPVSHRNLSNMVEDEVVDALVSAVTAAYPRLSHRYYAMKARWLGLEKLHHWDRNAPLPGDEDRRIPWDEAIRHVTTSYERFSPELGEQARTFLAHPWIDAAVRPGKAGGAFSHPTVPSVHPYILMNYHGRARDVMTLAHELGHAVHQTLSAERGYLLASTPLTLAETASVFGEMLAFRSWLDSEADPLRRRHLLAAKIEDSLNTVVRQIAFYKFETQFHSERRSGELLPTRIDEIWLGVQSESLGPAFDFTPDYGTYWAYIPHFVHSPFYVYAYAFGECLVAALYGLYESGHPSFQSKYLDVLRAGGTKRHQELLAPFGVDATDPTFWNRGLDVIASWIDELERISDG
jgi:oligoendopeptidase F